MTQRIIALFLLCSSIMLTASCAHKPEDQRLTEQQYYDTAQKAMNNQNYLLAIDQLEQLDSRFPFGRYNTQVVLDLMYSYYKNLDFDSAAEQADRFIRLYPDHPNADYAYYLRGLAHSSLDRGILSRILPSEPSERDLASAQQAFTDFNQLLQRFPNSFYAADAYQRMIYLRNLLAEHELHVADYYFKRRAYVAAANRAQYIVKNFQGTPIMPDALAITVRSYRAMRMNDLADQTEHLLASNFPHYKELDAQGRLVLKKPTAHDEKSWLNIMSFGLAN